MIPSSIYRSWKPRSPNSRPRKNGCTVIAVRRFEKCSTGCVRTRERNVRELSGNSFQGTRMPLGPMAFFSCGDAPGLPGRQLFGGWRDGSNAPASLHFSPSGEAK